MEACILHRVFWVKETHTSVRCVMTTPLGITMVSGHVKGARLSSNGAFKVTLVKEAI